MKLNNPRALTLDAMTYYSLDSITLWSGDKEALITRAREQAASDFGSLWW